MVPEKNTILFTLIYSDEEYQVQTYRDQYYSLMALISDHLGLLDFGLCSGMGSCGTCLVAIRDKFSNIPRTTLSCDVRIDEELSNTIVTISQPAY